MAKRISGAGVNRMAARKASEVRAARVARLAAYEANVTEAVRVYFDRVTRADQVRDEADLRAQRILAAGQSRAGGLDREADAAVARLRKLGEPVTEIAAMIELPVTGVRAALARASDQSTPVGDQPALVDEHMEMPAHEEPALSTA